MHKSEKYKNDISVMHALAQARKKSGTTQQELAERTGITQADISRLERGNANPSIRTLQRLATGMGMILTMDLQPASDNNIRL